MSAYDPAYDAEPDWDAVFADEGVTEVTHYAPPNTCEMHSNDDDVRILDNARKQAPWLKRVMAGIVTADS